MKCQVCNEIFPDLTLPKLTLMIQCSCGAYFYWEDADNSGKKISRWIE